MSNIDESKAEYWGKLQEQNGRLTPPGADVSLKHGGGSGTFDGMDGRVSRLEAHMEHIQEDMREVKADLKTAIGYLSVLPNKRDLDTWRWQWLATGVGIVALTIGGITGGLALIAKFAS